MLVKLAEKAPEGAGGDQAKQAMAFLKQMEGFSTAVTIDKDIDFQLGVNTMDNETATKYAGLGNILMGAAKLKVAEQAKKDAKFAAAVEVLNTIQIEAKSSNLLIRGQITFDTLQKIMQNIPMN
jgi:hypothetical protein